jgi:hypothetical protein
MHKGLSSILSTENLSTAQGGWNKAIAEAERQIREVSQRAKRLKETIQTLKQLRDEGATLNVVEVNDDEQ